MAQPKRPPVPRHACAHTRKSDYIPDHTHICNGVHQSGMHMCPGCRRWFA